MTTFGVLWAAFLFTQKRTFKLVKPAVSCAQKAKGGNNQSKTQRRFNVVIRKKRKPLILQHITKTPKPAHEATKLDDLDYLPVFVTGNSTG